LEFRVFGDEIAIADDRAELILRDGFHDFALHAAVEGGLELVLLNVVGNKA